MAVARGGGSGSGTLVLGTTVSRVGGEGGRGQSVGPERPLTLATPTVEVNRMPRRSVLAMDAWQATC